MPQPDLAGRHILFVGGRNRKATAHVRRLVEDHNGTFDHHDGGMEESIERLSNLLRKADAVIFPVEFVSHSALSTVKKHCRRFDTPYLPLKSTGLDSIAAALGSLPPA